MSTSLGAPTHGNATLFATFHVQNLARSSIAAPTTASAFLQVSLSKMPRSILRSLSILPEAFPIKANDFQAFQSDNRAQSKGIVSSTGLPQKQSKHEAAESDFNVHSARKASIGSTRAARQAGIVAAIADANNKVPRQLQRPRDPKR